ncbi:hypothetical protein ACXITY_25530, partial [Vibrio parahaemolyticus]
YLHATLIIIKCYTFLKMFIFYFQQIFSSIKTKTKHNKKSRKYAKCKIKKIKPFSKKYQFITKDEIFGLL